MSVVAAEIERISLDNLYSSLDDMRAAGFWPQDFVEVGPLTWEYLINRELAHRRKIANMPMHSTEEIEDALAQGENALRESLNSGAFYVSLADVRIRRNVTVPEGRLWPGDSRP